MDPGFGLWLFAVSLGASALGGMLGMASGILIVPILTVFGHTDIRTAIGASLVSVIACSCASASPLLKGGLVNIRLAIVLETTTTLGALTGVLLVGIISTAYLFILFALILALSAQQMLARRGEKVITNDLEVEPIFTLLETKYDMPLVEAEYRLEAVAAQPAVAEALSVETGSPLFRIERTSYCAGNQPVDYEQLYYRGDMVRFVTRLARRPKEGK